MTFNEYLEIATEKEIDNILKDEEIEKIFKTPFGDLEDKYRNLLPYPGELNGDDTLRDYYTRKGRSLESIIRSHFNFEDDFDEENWEEDEEYFDPYFVYEDNTREPCGYIVYELKNKGSLIIKNIILFSFNLKRKDFGKQIWRDLEKDLEEKIVEGYKINWRSRKSNPACQRYDTLINKFKGKKASEGEYWVYSIGGGL